MRLLFLYPLIKAFQRSWQSLRASIFLTFVVLFTALAASSAGAASAYHCSGLFTESAGALAPLNPQQIRYEILGAHHQGAPVVFIHGVGASLETFHEVARTIAKSRTVILYDLRGHGRTMDTGDGFQIETQVKDLEGLLASLKIKQYHLIGHSAGAKIAMMMASKNPGRVASIVLEDSGPTAISKSSVEEKAETQKTAQFLRNLNKQYKNVHELEMDLAPLYPQDSSTISELAQKVFPLGPRLSAVTKQFWIEFKTSDTTEFLKTYAGPTLFLRAFPPTRYLSEKDVEQIKSQMPQARIIDMPDGSHSIHRKQPALWSEKVGEFLEEVAK